MEALAVISLAIQVGECAIRISHGIATIFNAPEELSRLRRHTEGLYGIIDSARIFYDLGQKATRSWDERTVMCVYSALSECRDATDRIEALLNKATKARNQRSSSWLKWPHIWLIRNRSQVEKLEKDIDSAVLMLNLAMTLQHASIQVCLDDKYYATESLAPLENNIHSTTRIDLIQKSPDEEFGVPHITERGELDYSDVDLPTNDKCVVSRGSSVYRYQTPLGTLSMTKKYKRWQGHGTTSAGIFKTQQQTADTYICFVQPSFLSRCLELRATLTSLHGPELGLRSVNIMDRMVEETLRHALFYNDLNKLKRLLSDGAVSLDSVDRGGQSLLWIAQLYQDEEAVTFLVRQGCPVGDQNIQLCTSENSLNSDTFRLLYSRSDLSECTVDTIFPDVSGIINSRWSYEWYITQSWASTCLSTPEWFGSRLYVEAQVWAKLVHKGISNHLNGAVLEQNRSHRLYWENLLLQSIRRGADLHYLNEDRCTTFGAWMQLYHPLDVEEIIEKWLIILRHCDKNTTQYLRKEVGLYKEFQNSVAWEKRFLRKRTVRLYQTPENLEVRISWQAWGHDQSSAAGLVLQEFVGFGDDEGFSPLLKFSRITERNWRRFWPFSYTTALYCEGHHFQCSRCSRYKRRENDVVSGRERTDVVTMENGTCTVGGQPVMPGSWVD